jgi:DNA-binding response OmpR family regulator
MRILIADDDRELSALLCTVLRHAGHQAFPAFDGASTMMSAMRLPQPNLIILDVRMPAGDGRMTLTKLKMAGKTAGIPVLVLTASDDPEVRAEMMDKGAAGYMQKPFDPEELLAMVASFGPGAAACRARISSPVERNQLGLGASFGNGQDRHAGREVETARSGSAGIHN